MNKLSILYFGHDWDSMWRRRQLLAYQLAQEEAIDRVVYVQEPLTILSFMKFLVGRGHLSSLEQWARVTANRSLLHRVTNNLHVVTPIAALPLNKSRVLTYLDYAWRDYATYFLLRRLGFAPTNDNWIVWVSNPWMPIKLVQRFRCLPMWYDCTEDFSVREGFPPLIREMIRRNDEYLTRAAGAVSVVSQTQFQQKQATRANVFWIPNAVDMRIFHQQQDHALARTELHDIPRPRIILVGAVNDYLDWDLVRWVARQRPDWSLIFVGPVTLPALLRQKLSRIPSVHLLGKKDYFRLPLYLEAADVCIQCYRKNYSPSYESTQKLFLYLAAGKPVVCREEGSETQEGGVVTVGTYEGFIAAIQRALDTDSDQARMERQEIARRNSWESRTSQIVEIMQTVLHQV